MHIYIYIYIYWQPSRSTPASPPSRGAPWERPFIHIHIIILSIYLPYKRYVLLCYHIFIHHKRPFNAMNILICMSVCTCMRIYIIYIHTCISQLSLSLSHSLFLSLYLYIDLSIYLSISLTLSLYTYIYIYNNIINTYIYIYIYIYTCSLPKGARARRRGWRRRKLGAGRDSSPWDKASYTYMYICIYIYIYICTYIISYIHTAGGQKFGLLALNKKNKALSP